MRSILLKLFFSSIVAVGFVAVSPRLIYSANAAACEPTQSILGLPTWYKYLEGEEVAGKCTPKIENTKDALPIGLSVLEIAMTLSGLVAVVMVFWGSFKYVISQGEPEKAAGARKTVINAAIGLVIIMVSTRVVSFMANTLTSDSGGTNSSNSSPPSQLDNRNFR